METAFVSIVIRITDGVGVFEHTANVCEVHNVYSQNLYKTEFIQRH